MFAIQRAMLLRFLRLKVWAIALIFPAAAALAAALRAGPSSQGPEVEGARVLLFSLQFGLPLLAAAFLLSLKAEAQLDLLLLRPGGWKGIILGRWSGTSGIFGGCLLTLSGGLFLALLVSGGGPPGRVDREPSARIRGIPGNGDRPAADLLRPWPRGSVDPAWFDRIQEGIPWTFVFEGLPPGKPCKARARALIARVIEDRSGERIRRDLARAKSIPAGVGFLCEGDGRIIEGPRIDLRDADAVTFDVPAAAVGPTGRLVLILSRTGGDAEEMGEGTWGPPFFWFDPGGGGDPFRSRDVKIVAGEISFAENALRASLVALGELIAVAALSCAAAALFSQGVAIGLTFAVYLLATSKPFLADVLGTLSHESALDLFHYPSGLHLPGSSPPGPTWIDRGLEGFLRLAAGLLPDLQKFRGDRFLFAGEAVDSGMVLDSILFGLLGAAIFLGAALLVLSWARRSAVRSRCPSLVGRRP